jgi:hypothetical protein
MIYTYVKYIFHVKLNFCDGKVWPGSGLTPWIRIRIRIEEPGGNKEMSSILADQQRPRIWAQMGGGRGALRYIL